MHRKLKTSIAETKQKKMPKHTFLNPLKKLLVQVDSVRSNIDFDNLDDLNDDIWMEMMKPFTVRGTDLSKLNPKTSFWVIEPQSYKNIVKLEYNSELHKLLEESMQGLSRRAAATTGDGPGYGDRWYKASPKLLRVLRNYIALHKIPKKGMLRSLSSKKRNKCLENMNKFRSSGAPKSSATCFRLGHVAAGRYRAKYKIIKFKDTRRWAKC